MPTTLSQGIYSFLNSLDEQNSKQLYIQQYTAHIEEVYQKAVETVFKQASYLVLQHTNAVYLLQKEEQTQFLIYSDDSGIRASLDARQGFLKIALYKQGINFDTFKIFPSKRTIKERHPFKEKISCFPKKEARTLTESEIKNIEDFVSLIEDKKVREALKQALISDLITQHPKK